MEDGILVDTIGGNCPVQAEGVIDGRRFYFRARGRHWSLEVSPTATGTYLEWPDHDATWQHYEEWGDGPYDAGWMPLDVAQQMIERGAALYRAQIGPPQSRLA